MMTEQKAETSKKQGFRHRRVCQGVVVSDARDKTIKVIVESMIKHPRYGKYIRQRTSLHAHDEKNEAGVGDTVEVIECRPLSKTKNWRLLRIVKKAEL